MRNLLLCYNTDLTYVFEPLLFPVVRWCWSDSTFSCKSTRQQPRNRPKCPSVFLTLIPSECHLITSISSWTTLLSKCIMSGKMCLMRSWYGKSMKQLQPLLPVAFATRLACVGFLQLSWAILSNWMSSLVSLFGGGWWQLFSPGKFFFSFRKICFSGRKRLLCK